MFFASTVVTLGGGTDAKETVVMRAVIRRVNFAPTVLTFSGGTDAKETMIMRAIV